MYIPSQEERYSKKNIVTMILCLMAPSGIYAGMLSSQLAMDPEYPILGLVELIFFFSIPLGMLFEWFGMPLFWWGMALSTIIQFGFCWILNRSHRITSKNGKIIAISLGMINLFILNSINSMTPETPNPDLPGIEVEVDPAQP